MLLWPNRRISYQLRFWMQLRCSQYLLYCNWKDYWEWAKCSELWSSAHLIQAQSRIYKGLCLSLDLPQPLKVLLTQQFRYLIVAMPGLTVNDTIPRGTHGYPFVLENVPQNNPEHLQIHSWMNGCQPAESVDVRFRCAEVEIEYPAGSGQLRKQWHCKATCTDQIFNSLHFLPRSHISTKYRQWHRVSALLSLWKFPRWSDASIRSVHDSRYSSQRCKFWSLPALWSRRLTCFPVLIVLTDYRLGVSGDPWSGQRFVWLSRHCSILWNNWWPDYALRWADFELTRAYPHLGLIVWPFDSFYMFIYASWWKFY